MKYMYSYLAGFFLMFILGSPLAGAQETENRWENDILRFEQEDELTTPEKGGVVFVGSSSIKGWKSLEKDFPDQSVLNRGFGGSQYKDVLFYFDRIITKHQPEQVVLYSGDNDISSGKSPDVVFGTFKKIAEKLEQELPETELLVLAVKPSIARWELYDDMAQVNQMLEEYAAGHEQVTFVDIATPMLGEDGRPKEELFIKDGLHFNPKGYALWVEVLKPYLR